MKLTIDDASWVCLLNISYGECGEWHTVERPSKEPPLDVTMSRERTGFRWLRVKIGSTLRNFFVCFLSMLLMESQIVQRVWKTPKVFP